MNVNNPHAAEPATASPKEAAASSEAVPTMLPTYYVRHPDGSYSIAQPQPTQEQIAAQVDFTYAQCDRQHSGSCCEDPGCYLATGANHG